MSDNMEQLLDETLDDLADLPQSKPFPAGSHICDMVITRDAKKPSMYYAKFKYVSLLEFANPNLPEDQYPKVGDEATMFIHTKKKDGIEANEFGQGQLKMILLPLSERLGTKSVTALIEATKSGIQVAITGGIKQQKDYADQMQLLKIQLV